MRGKMTAAVVVAAAAALVFMVTRTNARADAATSGCFAAEQGPSQPTLCQ